VGGFNLNFDMKKNIKIFCTLGPSTLNKDFLKFSNQKISLLRINMSHVEMHGLKQMLKFIMKFSKVPICIDTEGAQIRTRTRRKRFIKKNKKLKIFKKSNDFMIYPPEAFNKVRLNDILNIGFDGLEVQIIKKSLSKIICKTLNEGILDNNKGIHVVNRFIKLNFITEKDKEAINIAKQMQIKHFALSFTNSKNDIHKFSKLLPGVNKIFKIESKTAIKNLNEILSSGSSFLIDRGDLSKNISTVMLPAIQRKIFKNAIRKKKKVYVATNFLESMGEKKYPTLAEANDIYNTLEMGGAGLVLASETAVGKYPKECVNFLRKMIKTFNKNRPRL